LGSGVPPHKNWISTPLLHGGFSQDNLPQNHMVEKRVLQTHVTHKKYRLFFSKKNNQQHQPENSEPQNSSEIVAYLPKKDTATHIARWPKDAQGTL
jgi:hypothetical protein